MAETTTLRGGVSTVPPRDRARRKADVLAALDSLQFAWLATAGPAGPHLIPLGCVWDGACLVLATHEANRTVRNLRESPASRVTSGSAADVVILEGTTEVLDGELPDDLRPAVERLPMNPARSGDVVVLVFTPRRVLAWRHRAEIPDRTVMRDGRWLA
jgi:hypothetical protein